MTDKLSECCSAEVVYTPERDEYMCTECKQVCLTKDRTLGISVKDDVSIVDKSMGQL